MKDKISATIIDNIAPLYEVWSVEADLDETERIVLYDKLFNPEMPTETDIAKKIFVDERTVRRIWKKVRHKIYKILP